MKYSKRYFFVVLAVHFFFALPVTFILGLGFFTEAMRYYVYFYNALIFPALLFQKAGGEIKGFLPLVAAVLVSGIIWSCLLVWATSLLGRKRMPS